MADRHDTQTDIGRELIYTLRLEVGCLSIHKHTQTDNTNNKLELNQVNYEEFCK